MLGLGLALELKPSLAGGAFDPLSVSPTVWYDPSDLSSMFQTTDTSTPAAVNSPVGRINDKSGNNNHMLQGAAGSRPILRQSGSLYYLEFDGVDDRLEATFALAQPLDRVSAIRQVSYTNGHVFGGATGNAGVLYQVSSGNLAIFDGAAVSVAAPLGVNQVTTERHNDTNSRVAINNGAYSTGTTGAGAPGGFWAGTGIGGASSNIWWFGSTLKAGALTDLQIASLRSYYAQKAGVTL